MSDELLVKQLNAQWIIAASFQRYGQVIYASRDGKSYDSTDAQLVLQNSIPRFYIIDTYNFGQRDNLELKIINAKELD